MSKKISLVYKYANAFYDIHKESCTMQEIPLLQFLQNFFINNKKALFLLGLPSLALSVKKDAVHILVKGLSLPESYEKVFMLLVQHQRTVLLPFFCKKMQELIATKHSVVQAEIRVSHMIDSQQAEQLKDFFERLLGKKIQGDLCIDKSLIAGVAFRSATYSWECSVKKKLTQIKQSLVV